MKTRFDISLLDFGTPLPLSGQTSHPIRSPHNNIGAGWHLFIDHIHAA
jgi:hypothetical protein